MFVSVNLCQAQDRYASSIAPQHPESYGVSQRSIKLVLALSFEEISRSPTRSATTQALRWAMSNTAGSRSKGPRPKRNSAEFDSRLVSECELLPMTIGRPGSPLDAHLLNRLRRCTLYRERYSVELYDSPNGRYVPDLLQQKAGEAGILAVGHVQAQLLQDI